MSAGEEPKWKRFERVIHEIHAQFAPAGATVTIDEKILGHDSQTERQIDVSIRMDVAGYTILIVVECKDKGRPIDVEEMGAFNAKVRDVRANKGVMVSTSGFTASAVTMAGTHGIDTRTYIDTESQDWGGQVAIPVLLKRTDPSAWSAIFSNVAGYYAAFPTNIPFPEIEIYGEDGAPLGTIKTVLARKWNQKQISYDPGTQRAVLGEHFIIKMGARDSHVRIEILMRVKLHYYFGPLPIKVKGLIDEQKGTISTNNILTDFIEPILIEQGKVPGWTEIPNLEELSARPVLTLGYSDILPDGRTAKGIIPD